MTLHNNDLVINNEECPKCHSEEEKPCVKLTRRGVRTVIPLRRSHPERVLKAIDDGYLPMGATVEED